MVRLVPARFGRLGEVRLGMVECGSAWQGDVRQVRLHKPRLIEADQVKFYKEGLWVRKKQVLLSNTTDNKGGRTPLRPHS